MSALIFHDTATPVLHALAAGDPKSRTFVNQQIGVKVQDCIRLYLLYLAKTKHATAEKLGAVPTGFYGQMYSLVRQSQALAVTPNSATVTVTSPLFGSDGGRLEHDVDIVPGPGKQWLTIPANAAAYGNRYLVGTAERARFDKAGNLLPPVKPGAPLYIFTKHVHQKQDRAILPTDEAILAAAIEGAQAGVDRLIEKAEAEHQVITQ